MDDPGGALSRALAFPALAAVALVTAAWAGNPQVSFAGHAGPYPLRVVIETPGVIPGLARIRISLPPNAPVDRVTVQPLYWNLPTAQAPAPDPTRRKDAGEFEGELWLMVAGSYGVRVEVEGNEGTGGVVVPVTAVAYERLDMDLELGAVLAGLAVFLAAGLATIVRAAAMESTLPAGVEPDRRARRRGWIGLAGATAVVGFAAVGGRAWWNNVDAAYRERLYHPPALAITVERGLLTVAIRDSAWLAARDRRPLVPDAGAKGHLFLAGDSAFAHLHADEGGEGELRSALPALPAGTYQVLVQVVDSSGFTETLGGCVTLAPRTGSAPPNGEAADGSFWFAESAQRACAADRADCRLVGDSMAMTILPGQRLAFELRELRGRLAVLDSGGTETAEVMALDAGGNLARVHPHGTMPFAALTRFSENETGAARATNPLLLPQDLPANAWKLWVTMRAGGRRYTGSFDLQPGGSERN